MSDNERPRCQNRMVSRLALAARLQAGDDLAELGMQRLLGELAGLDMRAQAAELAALALAPIVDHELGHDVRQRQLDRAHRAVGHDEGARLDPRRLQAAASGSVEARGLDDDVGALDAGLPILGRDDGLAEIAPAVRAKASRLSSRREWTRISSKSKRWSSRRTFQ